MQAAKPEQLSLSLVWESELVRSGDGTVTLVAKKPLSEMTVKRAAAVLKVSEWTVQKLWREGYIEGSKPGGARRRRDGRGSNARLVLDAGSVLAYKERQRQEARREQGSPLW